MTTDVVMMGLVHSLGSGHQVMISWPHNVLRCCRTSITIIFSNSPPTAVPPPSCVRICQNSLYPRVLFPTVQCLLEWWGQSVPVPTVHWCQCQCVLLVARPVCPSQFPAQSPPSGPCIGYMEEHPQWLQSCPIYPWRQCCQSLTCSTCSGTWSRTWPFYNSHISSPGSDSVPGFD